MSIRLNGDVLPLESPEPVSALIARLGYDGRIAVAVNGELVPRTMHADALVRPGDEVEIVAPMRGG